MSSSTDDRSAAAVSHPALRRSPHGSVHAAVVGGWVVSGFLMLSAGMVRWARTGPGSRFEGFELADNLRNGTLVPDWGRWVAAGLYSVIGLGGVFVATSANRLRGVIVVRAIVCLLLLVPMLTIAVSDRFPVGRWSAGPILVTAALICATLLSTVQLRTLNTIPRN